MCNTFLTKLRGNNNAAKDSVVGCCTLINQTKIFFLLLRENVVKGTLIQTNLFTIGKVFSYQIKTSLI